MSARSAAATSPWSLLARSATRGAVVPDQRLRGRAGAAASIAPRVLAMRASCSRLRQFGRLGQQRQQRLELDLGRTLGGVELGAGDRVERAGLHRVEPDLRVGPALLADRGEHRAIAVALVGIELGGNAARSARADAAAAGRPARRRRRAPEIGGQRAAQWPSSKRERFTRNPPISNLQVLPGIAPSPPGARAGSADESSRRPRLCPASWLTACKLPARRATSSPVSARLAALPEHKHAFRRGQRDVMADQLAELAASSRARSGRRADARAQRAR